MTRVKTVYPTAEVFHRFANRVPGYYRNPSDNVSVKHGANGSLYLQSYGDHYAIGAFVGDLLFWNLSNYSKTTAKHKSQAWRALPAFRRVGVVYVEGMRCGQFDTPQGYSDTAKLSIDAACDLLEKSDKQRSNRPHSIGRAKDKFETARQLLQIIGDKKGAAKIPALTGEEDKAQILAIVRSIKGAEYLQRAADGLIRAKKGLEWARKMIAAENPDNSGHYWRRADDSLRDAANTLHHCASNYKQAGKKNPRGFAAIEKEIKTLRDAIGPRVIEETRAEIIDQLYHWWPDALRKESRAHREVKTRANIYGHNYALDKVRKLQAQLERIGHDLPETIGAQVSQMMRRHACQFARWQYRGLLDSLSKPQSSNDLSTEALRRSLQNAADKTPGFKNGPEWRAFESVAARVREWNSRAEALRLRTMGEKIQAWREGHGAAYLGHSAPVMARVKGETVETSLGATVPLSHAARLVRMARIAARKGGQEWAPGNGPRVGHYQVTRIGADLSATIGCHNFSATEGARACDLIESAAVEIVEDCEG